MECYTIQMARHRSVDKEKMLFLDTTVKSGAKFLAPKWEMVMGHKQGTVSDEEYTKQFLEMMVQSQTNHPDKWNALFEEQRPIVFACYCSALAFCHRYLLISILSEYALKHHYSFEYLGEFG